MVPRFCNTTGHGGRCDEPPEIQHSKFIKDHTLARLPPCPPEGNLRHHCRATLPLTVRVFRRLSTDSDGDLDQKTAGLHRSTHGIDAHEVTFEKAEHRLLQKPLDNFILHTTPPIRYPVGEPESRKRLARDYHRHIELAPRLSQTAGVEWGSGFSINPLPSEDTAHFLHEADPDLGF